MCLLDHEFPAPKKNGIRLLVASGFVLKWSTSNSKGFSRVSPVKWDLWYIHTQSQTNPSQRMFLLTVLAFAAEDSTIESWWKLWLVEPRIVRLQKSEVIIFLYIFHIREAFTKNQILLEVSERFHISLPKMKSILIIVKLHPQQENLKKLRFWKAPAPPPSPASQKEAISWVGNQSWVFSTELRLIQSCSADGAEPSSMTYSRKMGRSNGFGALTAMLSWRLCSLWFLLFA